MADDVALAAWGKDPEAISRGGSPYPVLAHLLDTAVVAGALWDSWLCPRLRAQITEAVSPGDEQTARSLTCLVAGLHDVGKANPLFAFQQADLRPLQWRASLQDTLGAQGFAPLSPANLSAVLSDSGSAARRHEYVGYVALTGENVDAGDRDGLRRRWLPTVVSGHHGKWLDPSEQARRITPTLCEGHWGASQRRICEIVMAALRLTPQDVSVALRNAYPQTVLLLSGLVVLADWLASDDERVAYGQSLIRSQAASPVDGAEWMDARSTDLLAHVTASVGAYVAPVDRERTVLGSRIARPLQEQALTLGDSRGLWIVACPTGEGKTEASLLRHMADDREGLLFALPTRATTDAMQKRLEAIFDDTGNRVVLSHQFAAAQAPAKRSRVCGADLYGTEWFTSSVRRLIAPVSAMTCDQVLMGALQQKHAALRLLALANHHVVLDEVHTYDQYQSDLLCELLAWWGATGTRVTLLSATLPRWQQQKFMDSYERGATGNKTAVAPLGTVSYPSQRMFDPSAGVNDNVAVPLSVAQPDLVFDLVTTTDRLAEHTRWATAMRAQHPRAHIGVVVNTVDACIDIGNAIAARNPDSEVVCLHSRMTQAHRHQIENNLRHLLGPESRQGLPVIVVATQVIEASLDIDFDLMSSDLAPAPSLVQRAGRLWRFRDPTARQSRFTDTAPVERRLQVVEAVNEHMEATMATTAPYLPSELARVRNQIRQRPVLRVPEDVQGFVDNTVFDLTQWVADMEDGRTSPAELAEATKRVAAARQSAAALTQLVAGRHPTYSDLVRLTSVDAGADELMRTRYIDHPGGTYLLLDTRGERANRWASTTPANSLHEAPVSVAVAHLGYAIPVSEGLDRLLRPLHAKTLADAGLAEWEPRTRLLAGLLPLDLGLVESADMAVYLDDTGLTRIWKDH